MCEDWTLGGDAAAPTHQLPPRPPRPYLSIDDIPETLKAVPHWVVWRYEDHGKPKRDKVPYNPRTRKKAAVNEPATWGTFAEVVAAYEADEFFDGVGRVLTAADPLVGIDLDHCRDAATGALTQQAVGFIERIRSYTEASPSGEGLRIFATTDAPLPDFGRKKGAVEIYESGRFLTVTGQHIGGQPTTVERRTAEVLAMHTAVFGTRTENGNGNGHGHSATAALPVDAPVLSDDEVLKIAKAASNKKKFTRLWEGDSALWTEAPQVYPSPSEADLALCSMLAFYAGPTGQAQVDRLFRQSGLYRANKWNTPHHANGDTYGQGTINAALAHMPSFYAPRRAKNAKPTESAPSGLPIVAVTDRPLREMTAESLTALVAKNTPPALFVRSGRLTRRVFDEDRRPVLDPLTESALCGFLTRSADFVTGKDTQVAPPLSIVRDVYSLGTWPFPPLVGVVECPVLRPDGTICSVSGYDAATRLLYEPAPGLAMPALLDLPTQDDARAAARFIFDELLSDFPFCGPADKANMVAGLLTPAIRAAIRGNIPLCLLDKPSPGTGATLLADLIAETATGSHAAKLVAPEERGAEAEWQKKITALLLAGSPVAVIDNVKHTLASSSLSAVLTTSRWTDRILGRSEMVTLPARTCWIATANNISVRDDLARRCYRVRIDSEEEHPWTRTDFRHPELLQWAQTNRGLILAALLTIARAWFVAGQPKPDAAVPKLGGFEPWTRTVGGMLAYAGVPGFLANQADLYASVDEEGPEWDAFLRALTIGFDHEWFTVADVADSKKKDSIITATIPESIEWDHPEGARKRLGWALRKHTGRIYGGLRLEQNAEKDPHRKALQWRVAPASKKEKIAQK